MKRLNEKDQAHVDRALDMLAGAKAQIEEIDLRQYGGDEDVRTFLKRARAEIKGVGVVLRAVKALKWERR